MNACRARGMGSVLFESLPEPGVGTSSVSSYSGTTCSVAALSLWWCAVYVSATYTCTHPHVIATSGLLITYTRVHYLSSCKPAQKCPKYSTCLHADIVIDIRLIFRTLAS